MGKLDETKNLLQLFCYAAGVSQVPKEYFMWAGIALISAVVQDRVGYKKMHDPMAPNLMIFLIGPSGSGKDTAIKYALRYVKDNPRVPFLKGRATAQYLIDRIGQRDDSGAIRDAKLWLISPELSFNIGSGEQADTMVKFMTAIYGDDDIPIEEGTRTNQGTKLRNICVNWLAGTIIQWLKDCVSPDAVEGGFFARSVCVKGYYDFSKKNRFIRPLFPPDYQQVFDYVQERIDALTHIRGEFVMTEAAQKVESDWFYGRDEPANDLVIPWWVRQHDLVLKLAMVFSLADGIDLTIQGHHMQAAIKLAQDVGVDLPDIMRYAAATGATKELQTVMDAIKKLGDPVAGIPHSQLLRAVSSRGIRADNLHKIVATLQQANIIKVTRIEGTNALSYRLKEEEK